MLMWNELFSKTAPEVTMTPERRMGGGGWSRLVPHFHLRVVFSPFFFHDSEKVLKTTLEGTLGKQCFFVCVCAVLHMYD